MGKKIVETATSPLMYISQPNYVQVKSKMQQSYVVKPKVQMVENISVDNELEKTIEENTDPFKKNFIEEKTKATKNSVEEMEIIQNSISETSILDEESQINEQSPIELERLIDENHLIDEENPFDEGNIIDEENPFDEDNIIDEDSINKRNIIATFGLKSSIESGRKVSAHPKNKIIKRNIDGQDTYYDQVDRKEQQLELQESEQYDQEQNISQRLPFKELSIEEKVDYLLHLPLGIPRIKCEIETKEENLQGVIVGYADGVVKIVQKKKPHSIEVNIEEIIGINRKSF